MLQLTRERDTKSLLLWLRQRISTLKAERAIHNPRLQRFEFPKGKRVRQIAVWVTSLCVCRGETRRQQRGERRDCRDAHADLKMERVHTIWVNNIKYLVCFFSASAGSPLGWRVACVQMWPAQNRICLTQISSRLRSPGRPIVAVSMSWWCCYWLTKKPTKVLLLFKKTKYNKPGEKLETQSVQSRCYHCSMVCLFFLVCWFPVLFCSLLVSLSTFCSPVFPVFLCSFPPWHLSQISFVSTALLPVSLCLHLVPSLVQFVLKPELFPHALLVHLFPSPPVCPLFRIWSSFLWFVLSFLSLSLSSFFFFFYLVLLLGVRVFDLVFVDFIRSSLICSLQVALCLHLGPRHFATVTPTDEKLHPIYEWVQVYAYDLGHFSWPKIRFSP